MYSLHKGPISANLSSLLLCFYSNFLWGSKLMSCHIARKLSTRPGLRVSLVYEHTGSVLFFSWGEHGDCMNGLLSSMSQIYLIGCFLLTSLAVRFSGCTFILAMTYDCAVKVMKKGICLTYSIYFLFTLISFMNELL